MQEIQRQAEILRICFGVCAGLGGLWFLIAAVLFFLFDIRKIWNDRTGRSIVQKDWNTMQRDWSTVQRDRSIVQRDRSTVQKIRNTMQGSREIRDRNKWGSRK